MSGGGEEDELKFLIALGLILGATALVALVLSWVKQSVIVAFISVGLVANMIFNHVIHEKPDMLMLRHFKEVGVLMLLFMAGLEVDLEATRKKWKEVTIVGIGQVTFSTTLSTLLAMAILPAIASTTTNGVSCLYFGFCMTFSSTILVLGYLKTTKTMGTAYGQLCLGTLVIQDVISVLAIAAIPSVAPKAPSPGRRLSGGSDDSPLGVALLKQFGMVLLMVVIAFLLSRFVVGKLFHQFARNLELLYLGALGYSLGLAGLAHLCGTSSEIAAFLAGVSLTHLPYKLHVLGKMEPLKTLGVALFFVALGLDTSLDDTFVKALPAGIGLGLLTVVTTLPYFMSLGYCARIKAHNCYMVGMLMNQISEFSLIVAEQCLKNHIFDKVVLSVLTIAAVVSIVISSIGHIFVDTIYPHIRRRMVFRAIDNHYKRACRHSRTGLPTMDEDSTICSEKEVQLMAVKVEDPHNDDKLEVEGPPESKYEWNFEAQLVGRSFEQLQSDLRDVELEMDTARRGMSETAEQKHRGHAPRSSVSGIVEMSTSHATDIVHGLIEGYVIVDRHMMFCTLRGGRMMFWEDQHDIGHVPPVSTWDISGMIIVDSDDGRKADSPEIGGDLKKKALSVNTSETSGHSSTAESDDEYHPWEWTIRLAHLHRTAHAVATGADPVQLEIHGFEDHSDHDWEDWRDALSVVSATLNPIALRRAHIKEALTLCRPKTRKVTSAGTQPSSVAHRLALHEERERIICIGYNEMFPAVVALGDALNKTVVLVEYDPYKIKAVKKRYSKEKRLENVQSKQRRGKEITPRAASSKMEHKGFNVEENLLEVPKLCEVHTEYADIHDPEAWEETEMDEAFMIISCMKGTEHALTAIGAWLKKVESETVFVACTSNNVEALHLYNSGAHFVLQTDALAMRSTREIFFESIVKVGDCSQLISAGQSHARRLKETKLNERIRFLYETGQG